MTAELRSLRDEDLEPLLQFWAGMPGVGLNESDTPAGLRIFLERNPGLSLIATDGDAIAGAVLCGHDGRRGYLHHLAVAIPYRRQGLARRMVDECLTGLRRQGIRKCNNFLYDHNADGAQFWSRCGWSRRSDLVMMQHLC